MSFSLFAYIDPDNHLFFFFKGGFSHIGLVVKDLDHSAKGIVDGICARGRFRIDFRRDTGLMLQDSRFKSLQYMSIWGAMDQVVIGLVREI